MRNKILGIIFLVVVALLAIAGIYYLQYGRYGLSSVAGSFDDCIKNSGARMLQTYPEQCVMPNGQRFTNPNQVAPEAPLPDSATADWKTYTNTQYGFEFKYPSRMSEKAWPDWLTGFMAGSGGSIGLNIKSGTLSKDKVVSIYGSVPVDQITERQIAGQTAYYFNEGDAGCGGHKYFIPLKGKYLIMQFSNCEEQTPYLTSQEENQILSTFKFTDENLKMVQPCPKGMLCE